MPVIARNRSIASVTALALLLGACGGVGSGPVHFKAPPPVDTVDQYRKAVRHAAYARVAARAGEDAEAYAAYRAALALHAEIAWAAAAAAAAERAGMPGEAHDNWQLVARLADDDATRGRALKEAERLGGQIPVDATRVAIVVSPTGARVELVRDGETQGRPVIGDDAVWLLPGKWRVEDPENLQPGGVAELTVGPRGPRVVSVRLAREGAPVEAPRRVVRPAEPKAADPKPQDPNQVVDGKRTEPGPADPKPQDPAVGPTDPNQPDPNEPAPVAPGRSGIHAWGPYVVAGLGVGALAAGGVFGKLAMDHADIANGLNPKSATYEKNLTFYGDGAKQNALVANLAFAAGGLLVAGGAAWWFLRPQPRATVQLDAAAADQPALTLGFTGRSVLARWTF
ncbi:MAG: hypothetical protein RIT45_1150 [Pseudomonadota bacterium]|jgi:hypothetical protein